MALQVFADAVQVSLQLVHPGMLLSVLVQDAVQVEVEDVGMEAADLHVALEEDEMLVNTLFFSKYSALIEISVKLMFGQTHLVSVGFGHQSDTGVLLQLFSLSLKREINTSD